MNILKSLFTGILLATAFPLMAEEQTTPGFISDDLFIYMHSGAGSNYRIVGTVNAGAEIQLTNTEQNGYTQIIDPKGKTTWVESQYVSTTPGLRNIIAELNGKLADTSEANSQLENQIAQAQNTIDTLNSKTAQLNNDIASLNKQLSSTQAKLKDQDTNLKKEWFYNGAMVLGIGLLLGLVLPRLGGRRKNTMENWN
ncbi:TIGR04211 family SH3 domain-containing protein [Colwelliaceae bacterium 6471]